MRKIEAESAEVQPQKKAKGKHKPAKKAVGKIAKKITAKGKKAAQHVKKELKKATVLSIPADKPAALEEKEANAGILKSHVQALRSHVKETKEEYIKSLDEEKYANFKKELAIVLKGGAYIVVSIVFFVALVITVELHSDNRVLAKTRAGSLELGYLEYEQAKEELQKEVKNYFQTPLVFSLGEETTGITPEELGIRPSIEQTMERLPVINFTDTNPAKLLKSLFYETSIAPVYTMDSDKIIKTLEAKFNLAGQRASNARLVYKDDGFEIQPEKSGKKINREQLISAVKGNLDGLETSTITLEMENEEPRIGADQLALEKDRLLKLLENPITLKYEKQNVVLKLIDRLDAVTFEDNNQINMPDGKTVLPVVLGDAGVNTEEGAAVDIDTKIRIAVDIDKLEEFLGEQLYTKIEIPTSPANIYKNEEGKVIIEGKGEDGRAVAKKDLEAAIALAVNNGIAEVPVPVFIDHAPLTISDDLKDLGVKELIATGHSAYYGSPANRMFNIQYGTEKYNGLLIEPGAEFSFNDILGPVDAASGFKPEKVIKKDKLEMEYGGGICQVSTTFYRAALLAGLPITERKPHSWKVSYYSQSMGDGLDATIYPGVSDLKFLNDTPATLLIQAYTEGSEAYFKIYGTNDGRTITMDGPHGGGLTYRWNRTIAADGEETTEEIWSRYRPIPPPEKSAPKPVAAASTVESSGQVNFSF